MPLPLRRAEDRVAWHFFTEERSLRRALTGELEGRFLPVSFPLTLLDDKWAFAVWLASESTGPQGLAQWRLEDADKAAFPVLLKSRHSWVGQRKIPRGWVCANPEVLEQRLRQVVMLGLEPAWFFLQQWLGDVPMRLVSVAGFFDADDASRHLTCVTERLASYGDAPSSSALLVTVNDDWGLIAAAHRVLERLAYRGPYEMEFVLQGNEALILELNPRFWMQHGLFTVSGNGLVLRYLGLDEQADRQPLVLPAGIQWVDGFWALRRILSGDLALLRSLRAGPSVICPEPSEVLKTLIWRAFGSP